MPPPPSPSHPRHRDILLLDDPEGLAWGYRGLVHKTLLILHVCLSPDLGGRLFEREALCAWVRPIHPPPSRAFR